MTTATTNSNELQAELSKIADNYQTLQRVTSRPYPVGQTPKEVIWTLNKAKLYRYIPVVPPEKLRPVPLLLVFALMNRPTILDLRPKNSFVEHMVNQGYDVYLLDWGSPGPEDRNLKFDDYVLDYMPRAIRKMKAVSGADSFSLLGWCIGAILTTLYAALRPNDGIKNLILLTAPLDFSDQECGTFARWISERYFDIDRLIDSMGNMPGELLDYGAKALKPVENYVGSYMRLWDNLDNPKVVESWHAMNTWVTDLIPMAGAAYRQFVVDLYRENRLMNGTLNIRGQKVDLQKVRASVLNLVATEDHIVPPCQTEGIMEKFGSKDATLLKIAGGHIGMMAGSQAVKRTWPKLTEWLDERSGTPRSGGKKAK
ncbi:MAG: alpha/beta fold hydrolase [Chloroflexota bacterium]